jgi:uncharacterized repeat protein (TIGR03943 family)
MVAAVSGTGGTITMLVGAAVLRLSLTGIYRRYVRPEMGIWLAIAGIVVLGVGLATLVRAIRHDQQIDAHDHGEEVRVGWLLLAPIAALLLVAPPALGSYGVGRSNAVDIRAGVTGFDRLPLNSEPVAMSLLEFGQRAFDRDGVSITDVPVVLTGFVAGSDNDGFLLARYQIACCAADAAPVVVQVVNVEGEQPPRDQWVMVTGVLHPGAVEIPELSAETVLPITPPEDPYETG